MKKYIPVEIEVIEFEEEDIITTSGEDYLKTITEEDLPEE